MSKDEHGSGMDFMSAVDAAAFLGVHVETLRKLSRRNEIPCFKIGRDWRFSREALVRWADEQRSGGSSDGSSCSVLVIDDEAIICKALARSVEQFGCRAWQATSGVKGLELVAEKAPDLILLDLEMPDMNGPQFLGELRKTHPDLVVVIVTGYPDGDLMEQAAQYAPLMLLAKPVKTDQLERTVRMVLGERI